MMQRLMRACVSRKLPGQSNNNNSNSNDNAPESNRGNNNNNNDAASADPKPDEPDLAAVQSRPSRQQRRWQYKSLTLSLIRSPWRRSESKDNANKSQQSLAGQQPITGQQAQFGYELEVEERAVASDYNLSTSLQCDQNTDRNISLAHQRDQSTLSTPAFSSIPTRSVTIDYFPNTSAGLAPSATPEATTPTTPRASPTVASPCPITAGVSATATNSSDGGTYRDFKANCNAYISEPRKLSSSFNPENYQRKPTSPANGGCENMGRPNQLSLRMPPTGANLAGKKYSSASASGAAATQVAAASQQQQQQLQQQQQQQQQQSQSRHRFESGGSASLNSDDLMLDTDAATDDVLSELGTPAADQPVQATELQQQQLAASQFSFRSFRRTSSLRQKRHHQLNYSLSFTSSSSRPRSISSPPPADDAVLVAGSDLRHLAQEAAAMRLTLLKLRRQLINNGPSATAAAVVIADDGAEDDEVCAECGIDARRVRLLETRLAELQAEADKLRCLHT